MHAAGRGPLPGGLQPSQASQPQQNLLEISWKDPGVPPNCLTVENIMHYFCQKENFFYDMTCDNQTIRMQHQNMNFPPPDAFDDILRQMNGIQYVLCEASPPLFVICKHKRHSRDHVTPMCYYYVLNSVVYQAPDIYALVQSRLVSVVDPLRDALSKTLDSLRFNVSKGYWWEFKSPAAKHSTTLKDKEKKSDMADADESNPFNVRATPFQRTRTDKLLQLLVERFPVDNMEIQYGETQASRLQASTNPSDADAAGSAVPDTIGSSGTMHPSLAGSASGANLAGLALPSILPSSLSSDARTSGFLMDTSGISSANAPTPPATTSAAPMDNASTRSSPYSQGLLASGVGTPSGGYAAASSIHGPASVPIQPGAYSTSMGPSSVPPGSVAFTIGGDSRPGSATASPASSRPSSRQPSGGKKRGGKAKTEGS